VQLLLDHKADAYVCDYIGDTAQHCAAAFGGYPETVRMLLELNLEVNSQNCDGLTPLH
jgi:ankyrin repeat protein